MSAVAASAGPGAVVDRGPKNKPNKKWTRLILPVYSILMMVYLASPVLVMILYGFNDIPGRRQSPQFYGFTLKWYKNIGGVAGLTPAFISTLKIAIPATILATAIGTLLGLAMGRYRFRGFAILLFVIFLAIAVPEIVLGSSLLTLFLGTRYPALGYWTILLSHISFAIPFVAITVRARVAGMDRSLENAAADLFAPPATAFFRVTLPIITPGIIAGALLAFVLSLDDFVITNFTSGQYKTFPIWVYGATRIGLPPQVNVMGTLLFFTGVMLVIVSAAAQKRRTAAAQRS
jgi:spermidine/putrescine transport system permease protein